MPSIGWQEVIIILVILMVVIGPRKLPELGRSLGRGIREFKSSSSMIQEQSASTEPQAGEQGGTGTV